MNQVPLFDRVAIVGVGLLGASLGLALRRAGLAQHVTGIGRAGSESLQIARDRGAVDEITTDMAQGLKHADMVVLATNISEFPAILAQLAQTGRPGCIITDVASTKGQVMDLARQLLPPEQVFIGSHPMTGSEKSGAIHARADLYRGTLCLLTPPTDSRPGAPADVALAAIRRMWEGIGMRTCTITPQEHDRWVAVISHAPHAVAAAIVNATDRCPAARVAIAGGFLDTTRIASGNVDMWTDIFTSNSGRLLGAIAGLQEELQLLTTALTRGDSAEVRQWLARAKSTRDAMVEARTGAARTDAARADGARTDGSRSDATTSGPSPPRHEKP